MQQTVLAASSHRGLLITYKCVQCSDGTRPHTTRSATWLLLSHLVVQNGVTNAAVVETAATIQQVPLIAFSSAVGKSRLLCEGLWGRAFLSAYNCTNDGERLRILRMVEGLGKGAGLALLAVSMVENSPSRRPSFGVSCPTSSAWKER